MFSDLVRDLTCGIMPDSDSLKKRFDAAMIKKMGVVKLPPSYWMQDPKINPRGDHLFWASLLLKDRERIDLAISVFAVELEEKLRKQRLDSVYKDTHILVFNNGEGIFHRVCIGKYTTLKGLQNDEPQIRKNFKNAVLVAE